MELAQLKEYALSQYRIEEVHKWPEYPDFSVLADPKSERFAALLMKVWDEETGEMAELCDLRCPRGTLFCRAEGITEPFRMKGSSWIGIRLEEIRDETMVYRLLDQAIESCLDHGNTITLRTGFHAGPSKYQDTPIPGSGYVPKSRTVPDRILKMMSLYSFKDGSFQEKCRNFYRQGKFMEDYEDHEPWNKTASRFFPTYHDLRMEQLRGYFTWRTNYRKGQYDPLCPMFAYIYAYELINGIGAQTIEERISKLSEFETAYLSQEEELRDLAQQIQTWKKALAVTHDLDPETARKAAGSSLIEQDEAMAVLRKPDEQEDQAVVRAFCTVNRKAMHKSLVLEKGGEEGVRLYASAWRAVSEAFAEEGKDLFEKCFGEIRVLPWRPFANAVYWMESVHPDGEYVLDEMRSYLCSSGFWKEKCYSPTASETSCLEGFLQECERLLRGFLNLKRPLKRKEANVWITPYLEAFLEAERRAKREAAKPKVIIRLEGLEEIRRDSLKTRDSLLTEEEKQELEEANRSEENRIPAAQKTEQTSEREKIPMDDGQSAKASSIRLDERQAEILRLILDGVPVKEKLRAMNEMAEIFADALNEALFDEIGDIAVECREEDIFPMEDYREELCRILGGSEG